jgi:phosphomannomutase
LSKLLVSVSGIRGIVGDSLTPEIALKYGRAFGRFSGSGKIIIGRDTRYHGPMIQAATAAGLMAAGCRVIDIGVVTTPTVEYAVIESGAAGGVVVTASHNPIEYNALKLISSDGIFLTEKQSKRFLAMVDGGDSFHPKKFGTYAVESNWDQRHIDAILNLDMVNVRKIKRRKFRVVVDCVNGTSSYVAAQFFASLGCRLKLINAIPDGGFPRPPEPAPENLKKLCRMVKAQKADIGFALDPDSDRLAMVNEKGNPVGEEYTLALGLRYILSRKKGSVAVNLSSSMINDYVAAEAGVKIYRTKVGEVNITEKLRTLGGIAGGEGNGGLIYPAIHSGRDGLQAAAIILSYMADSGHSISELAGQLPKLYMIKRKFNVSGKTIDFKNVEKHFPNNKIDKRDGIKVVFDDSWVQVRLSNTEPIARIMAESYDHKKAVALADTVEKLIVRK